MGTQSRINPVSSVSRFIRARLWMICIAWAMTAVAGWSQPTSVLLQMPSALAYDAQGNLYIAEREAHCVRRLAPDATLSTVAGSGTQGFAGDGGPAVAARLDSPSGLATNSAGDVFIADTHNHRIRKLTVASGAIGTVAGTGLRGFSGDNGPAAAAQIDSPTALAVAANGDLYVADAGNQRVRRISAANGVMTTVAGSGRQGFSGDGGSALAAAIDAPNGLALDAGGNLYLADTHNHRIRRVDAVTGVITTVSGVGSGAPGLATASGGTGPAATAVLGLPRGLAIGTDGSVYFTDSTDHRVRRIAADGTISTVAGAGSQSFAGDGAPAVTADLNSPQSVVVSPEGLVTVADTANGRVRQLDASAGPGAKIQTIVGLGAALSAGSLMLTGPAATSYGSGTLVATLPSGTTATGQITFRDVSPTSPASLGTATVVGGGATLSMATLGVGSHSIVASYGGDATHGPAQSESVVVSVRPLAISAVAQPVLILYGQPVPSVAGSLVGVLPQDSGRVSVVFGTSAGALSPAGSYAVSAVLSGPAAANYLLGGVTGSLTIRRASTATQVAASVSSAALGDAVSLTIATVSGTSGTPTGTITVLDGSTVVGTAALVSGSAGLSVSTLSAGTHLLSAAYAGDANFLPSTSTPASLTVGTGPDFSLASTGPNLQMVPSGSVASYTFSVGALGGGLASPVSLTVDGLPHGVTASFNPAYVPPGGQATPVTLTLQTTKTALAQNDTGGRGPLLAFGLGSPVIFLLWGRTGRGRPSEPRFPLRRTILASMACILFATLTSGCGDRVSTGTASQTPPTYTLTVTGIATSGSGTVLRHSVTITLQVL